jgi:hypothetical protein
MHFYPFFYNRRFEEPTQVITVYQVASKAAAFKPVANFLLQAAVTN